MMTTNPAPAHLIEMAQDAGITLTPAAITAKLNRIVELAAERGYATLTAEQFTEVVLAEHAESMDFLNRYTENYRSLDAERMARYVGSRVHADLNR